MILSARGCGCAEQNSRQESKSSLGSSCPPSLKCVSLTSPETESCGCSSGSEAPEETEPRIVSEIASKGKPYKEIEAIINNNRVIVRLQKEKLPPEYDPPCDCLEPESAQTENTKFEMQPRNPDITFQKSYEGCKTISVYPHPDPKKSDNKADATEKGSKKGATTTKEPVAFPTVNPEENPNIFVLKIKRKVDDGDKKHNLNLEFKTPRPWRNKYW